jgi:hypothetical protein
MHFPYSCASPCGPNDARGQGTTLPWPIRVRGAAAFASPTVRRQLPRLININSCSPD